MPPSPPPTTGPNPNPSPPMETITLTLALFLSLAFHAHCLPPPPSPSPSPSPSPPLKHSRQPRHHPREGAVAVLDLGKKLGIVFAGIAAALQVALAGFLVYKRKQLRKNMELGYRRSGARGAAELSPSSAA